MTDDVANSALERAFAEFPADNQAFLTGLSGGLDSTVLLHQLATIRRCPIRAIHVHHGLHPEADRWAEHCRTFCAQLGVKLDIIKVQVTNDAGKGIEAAARHARYAAFAAALREGECLVTAHHQDDQAETVLLRLLRGSGAGGLGAMRALRPFANGQHWRPLLGVPRAVLLEYAQRRRLKWVEDPSNADVHHDRNFLRKEVLPLLVGRWPQAVAALARSAMLLSEHEALLDEQTARRLAQVQGIDPNTLSVSALLQMTAPWRALVFRHWISALDLPALPATGIEKVEQELLTARPDAQAEFRWHGVVIRRWRDLLYVGALSPDLPTGWYTDWDATTFLRLPTGAKIRLVQNGTNTDAAAPMPGTLRVGARAGGERITLPGRGHSHAVKIALQDSGVPPWQRKRLPLVFAADGELLAVGDVLQSARAHAAGWSFRIDDAPADR
jgi:tRNA(Ile)-lysidine synthase